MNLIIALQIFLFIFIDLVHSERESKFLSINIDEDCLKCICTANTGCKEISECFEDLNEEIRCGMFLLKESQWNSVQKSSIKNLRQSNISNFDQCYSNYECSSDLVNAYTLMHFMSSDDQLNNQLNDQLNKLIKKNLTCADIAFYNQFGHNQIKNKIEHKYANVLTTHQCMNRTVNEFQTKLINLLNQLNHLNQLNYLNQLNKKTNQFNPLTHSIQFNQLSQLSHLNLPKIFQKSDQTKYLNISIVPRRCFDCIRTANSYNSQNSEHCSHPQLKCGAYAINFEYFIQVNGNLVTKHILPDLYNSTSEQENQNQILDTIDLLNKVSNADNNKQFRKESDLKDDESKDEYDDYKIDYNKKLSQLLDFDYLPIVAKAIKFDQPSRPKRKNSKLLSRLIGSRPNDLIKSRRNSKFSRELQDQSSIYKSVSMNEELSVQKLISTASFVNFVNCASNLKCSEQLINIYVKQHLADCNLDSTIDCDDFASLHWLGKKNCKQNTMLYSNLWKNFEYCSILADDVRKEELATANDETSDKNDKNYYEITHNTDTSNQDLPIFQVRPNLQPISNATSSNETPFHPDLNQYYSSNVVDLSPDCLHCICEASSNYNCSQVLNPPSNFYFSSYKIAPPPQIVYLKTNNRMPKTTSLNTLSQMNSLKRNLIKLMRNSDLETSLDNKVKVCDSKKQGCGPFSLTKLHFLESMIDTLWYHGAAGDWERCAESLECSIETVSKFVTKFSFDCTKDGKLSCGDFGLIHKFKDKCSDLNVYGNTDYYDRFEKCLIRLGLH